MAEKRTALFGRGSEVSSGQHGSRSPAGVCVFSICTAVRAERPISRSSASLGQNKAMTLGSTGLSSDLKLSHRDVSTSSISTTCFFILIHIAHYYHIMKESILFQLCRYAVRIVENTEVSQWQVQHLLTGR